MDNFAFSRGWRNLMCNYFNTLQFLNVECLVYMYDRWRKVWFYWAQNVPNYVFMKVVRIPSVWCTLHCTVRYVCIRCVRNEWVMPMGLCVCVRIVCVFACRPAIATTRDLWSGGHSFVRIFSPRSTGRWPVPIRLPAVAYFSWIISWGTSLVMWW